MSDNNQLAINPYYAGGIGALVGGAAGQWMPGLNSIRPIKDEYNSAQNLLTLEADKFEKLEELEKTNKDFTDNYDVFKKGREALAQQEKQEAETLANDVDSYLKTNDTANYKPEADFEYKFKDADDKEVTKKISELEADVNTAKSDAEVIKAVDDNAEVKAAKDALDKETDSAKKAELQAKYDEIRGKKLAEQDKVKKAQELVDKAKAERTKGMQDRIAELAKDKEADTPIGKLAKRIKEGFNKSEKAKSMVEATDAKYAGAFDKMKGFFKNAQRTTWKAAAGLAVAGAAIGAAIAYIVGPKNDVPSDMA